MGLLRQNCKQNYIFITVRLPNDVAKISPGLHYDLARLHYDLAKISLGLHYDLAKILPHLQYDVSKTGRIAIRSRHSCSRMTLRLTELLYNLVTVALRCSQDSQDCYTISPQLHYDVLKTRRIAIRYRHSCTTMSPLRLATWLLTTTLLATNFLLHQIKEKINITSYY